MAKVIEFGRAEQKVSGAEIQSKGTAEKPANNLTTDAASHPLPDKKLTWPATIDEMEAAGYVYWQQKKDPCSCGERISWFIAPSGKWQPFSAASDGARIVPHHAVCKRIKDFRDANKKHAERTAKPKPVQKELFEK